MKRNGFSRRVVQVVFLTILAAAFVPRTSHATGEASPTAVKAAYLRVLAKLVTWPQAAFADTNSPIVTCVLGDDPFGKLLDEAIAGRTAHGRRLMARRLPIVDGTLPPSEQLSGCHLLFVGTPEQDRLDELLVQLSGLHVLTVSDSDDFTSAGGVAQLQLVEASIRVRWNVQASDAAGLGPSVRLQRAAILEYPPGDLGRSD